jgi:hypothetical protein
MHAIGRDVQNAPFGAASIVMGTAYHNVPNGGYSLVIAAVVGYRM